MSAREDGGRIRVEGDEIIVAQPEGSQRLPLASVPKEFSDWLDGGRRAMYDMILDGSAPVRFFSQHLPMVVSHNTDSVFPFTCGNKGVGYLPREEHLDHFIGRYRDTIEACKGKPWQESLKLRVQTAAEFNLDSGCVDRRCLATLEIFERQTFRNLKKSPLASLLFTGDSPGFTSFQLNCVVEVIGPGDPRHTFITLARTMFEYDDFHITQHNFPFGYVFWISECTSKTPFRVQPSGAPPPTPSVGGMPWDAEALESIGRAPSMIQGHIRTMVEQYARQRGFERIDLEVLQEARRNLMDGR